MGKENQPRNPGGDGQPLNPFELPAELVEFFHNSGDRCLVMNAADQGTVYVVKAPEYDIQGFRGNIGMQVTHQLYRLPEAPVIRTVVSLYDYPTHPLRLETFVNVQEEEQRTQFASFVQQPYYLFTFYNQNLQHRLTKTMENPHHEETRYLLAQAVLSAFLIPLDRYDFDRAKAKVMEATSL